jgi:hypothetical protein
MLKFLFGILCGVWAYKLYSKFRAGQRGKSRLADLLSGSGRRGGADR